jgi:hypothetical protein
MQAESAITLLLPSVAYGNISIYAKTVLDSEVDAAVVKDALKEIGKDDVTLNKVARHLALKEIVNMKTQIDALSSGTFSLEQFPKK